MAFIPYVTGEFSTGEHMLLKMTTVVHSHMYKAAQTTVF